MRITKIFGALLISISMLAGCGGKDDGGDVSRAERKYNIVTTTGMIADAARNVGGDKVKVTALMGPGVDPHLYKASEGDVTRMADADLILYNGLHLEGSMANVLEKIGARANTFAAGSAIDEARLLTPPQFKGAHDPHIWFDVGLWIYVVEGIRDKLIESDIENAETYKENAANYLDRLDSLHAYVKEQSERIAPSQRILITAHDAFNYFGRAYGFEVRGLQGISTAAEAGTADVKDLAKFIAAKKVPAIFVESSVPVRTIEAVQAAVKARGFEVKIGGQLFSDAMGNPKTPEGNYIGMVSHNINTIVSALLGE
jgi:manganese/zinc/iron transport system substrate-binding protein